MTLVSDTDSKISIDGNGTLIIRNSSPSDSDQYVCLGANMLGVVNISVDLKVARKCEVNPIQNNNEFELGMHISFPCDIEVR